MQTILKGLFMKQSYALKLTDIENDKVVTLACSENPNYINFHFRLFMRHEVDLRTCNYVLDIDTTEEGVIETIGISKDGYLECINKFQNAIQA